MRKFISLLLCLTFIICLSACRSTGAAHTETEEKSDKATEKESVREPELETEYVNVGTNVGDLCPNLELTILDRDEPFSIHDNRGKITVLNFWFTTCPYCIVEMPHFYDVAKEYGQKVTVIALHANIQGVDLPKWIETNNPQLADGTVLVGWDDNYTAQILFNVTGFPTTVILDRNGVISDIRVGMMSRDQLAEAIQKAMMQ